MAIYEDTAPHNRVIYWYKVRPLENVNRALKMLYLKDGPETVNKLIAINVAITEDSVIGLHASAANIYWHRRRAENLNTSVRTQPLNAMHCI